MTESDLYKELGILTKEKERWEGSILFVSSLLSHESVKIQAKALWLLGEMGLMYPQSVQDAVPAIAAFLNSPEPLLRGRLLSPGSSCSFDAISKNAGGAESSAALLCCTFQLFYTF